jgi:hypothetical protein
MYQIKAGLDNQYKEYAEKNSDPYGSTRQKGAIS